MAILVIPERLKRAQVPSAIRRYFEERFPQDEKIEEIVLTNPNRCYVKIGKPKLHENKFDRIEYETQEFNLSFDLVRGAGSIVMEG